MPDVALDRERGASIPTPCPGELSPPHLLSRVPEIAKMRGHTAEARADQWKALRGPSLPEQRDEMGPKDEGGKRTFS